MCTAEKSKTRRKKLNEKKARSLFLWTVKMEEN